MLTHDQTAGLKARFPYFDPERAAPLFHLDQTGKSEVAGKTYPAVLMKNGARWHYDRESRPKKKTVAASGPRPILTDDPTLARDQLIIVEGEGDAVALLSIGFDGVAAIGGTSATHAGLFKGKRLYLLFDGDDAGRKGARAFALAALDAGAAAVHVANLPDGADPEEFAAKHESAQQAQAALLKLLGEAPAVKKTDLRAAQREQDDDDGFARISVWREAIEDARFPAPILMLSCWEKGMERPALAVYGPPEFGSGLADADPYPGTEENPPPAATTSASEYVWRALEDGALRVPERRLVFEAAGDDPALMELAKDGALTFPPPPPPHPMDGARLARRVHAFFKEWVYLTKEQRHLLTAFVLMVWRYAEADFDKMPMLHIGGASGTGKTQIMTALHLLCPFGFRASYTPDNLHRVVEAFRSFTLATDEFNERNMSSETRRKMQNTLNLSFQKAGVQVRADRDASGRTTVRVFRLFGPKILVGYRASDDEAVQRRTVEIDAEEAPRPVPRSYLWAQLPKRAKREAAEIRAELVAWAGRQTPLGKADPEDDGSHDALLERNVGVLLDAYWPLLYSVPEEARGVRKAVLARAAAMQAKWQSGRAREVETYLVAKLIEELDGEEGMRTPDGAHRAVLVDQLVGALHDAGYRYADATEVGRMLKRLGVETERRRYLSGKGAVAGVVANDETMALLRRKAKAAGLSEEESGAAA